MPDPHVPGRRRLLAAALASLLVLPACGGSGDGTHVEIGEATKAEVKSRAEMYKARALLKKKPKGAVKKK